MFIPNNKGTYLEIKLLEVRHMSRVKFFLPWLTKLRFETDVLEHVHVWPSYHT